MLNAITQHSTQLAHTQFSHFVCFVCRDQNTKQAFVDWGFQPALTRAILHHSRDKIDCVLRFDFRGCGRSEGEFNFGAYTQQVDDLESAVRFLADPLRLASTPLAGHSVECVALCGHSMGSADMLLYAQKHCSSQSTTPSMYRIPNLISLAGRFDMRCPLPFNDAQLFALATKGTCEWQPYNRSFIVHSHWVEERRALDMQRVVSSIDPVIRVLVLHGSKDKVIPAKDAQDMAQCFNSMSSAKTAASNETTASASHSGHERCTLALMPEAAHNFDSPQEEARLGQIVTQWINERSTLANSN